MTEGREGSLLVRSPCGRFVTKIAIPNGFSLAASRELLAHDHMHDGNDLCITLVAEFVLGAPTTPIDERSPAAAEAQQEPLPLHKHLMPWTPELFFLGSPSRYGQMGGSSTRRMAVTDQAGTKTFKQDGKKRDMITARSNVENMSVAEQKAAATRTASRVGKPPVPSHPSWYITPTPVSLALSGVFSAVAHKLAVCDCLLRVVYELCEATHQWRTQRKSRKAARATLRCR